MGLGGRIFFISRGVVFKNFKDFNGKFGVDFFVLYFFRNIYFIDVL